MSNVEHKKQSVAVVCCIDKNMGAAKKYFIS